METKTDKSLLMQLFKDHYPVFADIKILKCNRYETEDLVFHRPDQNKKLLNENDLENEADGIILEFQTKYNNPIPIQELAVLCNILCYGMHWAIHPDYGNIDHKELHDLLNKKELDTCWHHTQITKLRDSKHNYYKIEQGFCTCS